MRFYQIKKRSHELYTIITKILRMNTQYMMLLLCLLFGIVLTGGCVESIDPPEQVTDIFTPDDTESQEQADTRSTPVPTYSGYEIGDGYYVQPEILSALFTDVTPKSLLSDIVYSPKIQKTVRYFEHFNITDTYAWNKRILNVNVSYAPVILKFTFDGGQKLEESVTAEYETKEYVEYVPVSGTNGSILQIVTRYYYEKDGDKYEEKPEYTYNRSTVTPYAWFKVGIIKNFDSVEECREAAAAYGHAAVSEYGGLYLGKTSLLMMEEGFADGYSYDTKKTLKILAPGNYTIHMTGNKITTTVRGYAVVPPDWDGVTPPEELDRIYIEEPSVPVIYAEEEEEWY